ncbi:MAG: DUF2141 domain-containing protein [Gallionellaceae bacterium]|nr:MAG: DUF2141 domain-containing protein [Gallionellaceae bacterium]
MKRSLLILLIAVASDVWAGDLKLNIHGSGMSGKNLYVAVHSIAADFPTRDDKAIKSVIVAKGDVIEHVIQNVPAGEYAVAVFADMNGNGALDSNFVGIPNEPVGVSRDAKGRFGPPKFADAAFKVGDGVTALSIELK